MKEEQKYDLQCMHITVWMAGNAFKIDRISRLEEDWNGRYAASAATVLATLRTLFSRLCGPIRQNMREYAPS